ncbi:T9SS type A sorting domain-containing protein [Pseudofulvibacter geojedonensis]|uniref:T9SS type A sorting domain-containing protein n=1 Tax=Pseudofulvibacter geojedonensis TaxID=1123758 RepID=A0ABW3I2W0_9FLAO
MKKQYILLVLVVLYCLNFSFAQCDTAVTTVDDSFESYTTGGALSGAGSCWTALTTNSGGDGSLDGYTGVRDTGANTGSNCLSSYTFFGSNNYIYFISPKLNSIDGTHYAEFYAYGAGATLRMGTISNPSDYNTFTELSGSSEISLTGAHVKYESGVVANTTDEYFTVRISAPANHTSIKFDDFKWQSICNTTVATVDDDFSSYAAGAGNPMPTCWNSIGTVAAGVRTGGISDSNCIMSYNSGTGDMYIIAPKLSTINGSYVSEFQIKANNNTATYQVGTITNNTDANTFTPVGAVTSITDSFVLRNSGTVPSSSNEYFAIKITTVVPHTSVRIDGFKWNESAVLSTEEFTTEVEKISLFPNPSLDKQVVIQTSNTKDKEIAIYSLNGKKVFVTKSNLRFVDLSLTSLSYGIYMVKVTSNEGSLVKKLILK